MRFSYMFCTPPNFVPIEIPVRYKNSRVCRAKTREGYVLDPDANSPLEVDREGDFYINVGIEENQEGFKESEGDREGDHPEVVDAWL